MATTEQLAYPVKAILADLTFDDTGTVTIGHLPPKARMKSIKVFVSTAYNSATSDTLTIGHGAFGSTSADPDEFEASINLQTAGDAGLTLLQVGQQLSADVPVPITLTTTGVGTAATAGAATVIFEFIQP